MEVKFDIVKPNLYVVGNEVFFGIESSDVIQVSRSVDEVIDKHIGVLKVKKSDLELVESGKCKKAETRYDIPLMRYLDALERAEGYNERAKGYNRRGLEITNGAVRLFGLSYVIDAETIENKQDMDRWRELQHGLANPNEYFDMRDNDYLFYRMDREKTLEEMRRLHKELDPKIPENCAELVIMSGQIPYSEQKVTQRELGIVSLAQLKAKDKTKIEEARADLVERLKDVDGPCLSFDAPVILGQMMRLYGDAPELIQRYGDVLRSPEWQTRLFRLDP